MAEWRALAFFYIKLTIQPFPSDLASHRVYRIYTQNNKFST